MVVAGVDGASGLTGIAIISDARLVRRGTCQPVDHQTIARAVDGISLYKPDLVCLEDVYVGPSGVTALALAKLFGALRFALESRGITTVSCLASTWQTALLPITHRARREERKRAAQAFVLDRFNVSVGEDVADAICLAVWAQNAARDHASASVVAVQPRPSLASEAVARVPCSVRKTSGFHEGL